VRDREAAFRVPVFRADERFAVDFFAPPDLRAVERFADDFFAVDLRLLVDFLAVDFRLADDFFAVDLRLLVDFLAVDFRFVDDFLAVDFFFAPPVLRAVVLRAVVLRAVVDLRDAVFFFAADFFFVPDFFAEAFLALDFFFRDELLVDPERELELRPEEREPEREDDRVVAGTATARSISVPSLVSPIADSPHVSSAASAAGSLHEPAIGVCDASPVPLQSSSVM